MALQVTTGSEKEVAMSDTGRDALLGSPNNLNTYHDIKAMQALQFALPSL